jgi:poly(3-hydroxybutyrate) depolymerase
MWMVTANDAALDGIFADYVLNQLTTQTTVIKRLLDAGFAVLTPTADNTGFAWDTNLPPWLYDWLPAPDNQFLTALYTAIATGQLGPLSTTRWYATGVSSGGYMTSRMAVSYQGHFRALAIAAGSYATCGGGLPCTVPALPSDHPPTLFVHGGSDPLVPVSQMQSYYDALVSLGCETQKIVNQNEKHGWIPESPDAILAWFAAH